MKYFSAILIYLSLVSCTGWLRGVRSDVRPFVSAPLPQGGAGALQSIRYL
ncbi:MAG: hypothetical protein IJR01_04730 [Bacteroidales bacterium]|nr:hypothetical protein [Bacteroidales bacterium]